MEVVHRFYYSRISGLLCTGLASLAIKNYIDFLSDRVLRQIGLLQYIPINMETILHMTSRGRPDEDWVAFHAAHIEIWSERLQNIFDQLLLAGDDSIQAASIYMQWYWMITRRWISRPVQRPSMTFQPRGHIERALVDVLQQTNYSIRQLVDDPPATSTILETLTDICSHIDMIRKNIPILPNVRDSGDRDHAHASTSGHHMQGSPSTSSYQAIRCHDLHLLSFMPLRHFLPHRSHFRYQYHVVILFRCIHVVMPRHFHSTYQYLHRPLSRVTDHCHRRSRRFLSIMRALLSRILIRCQASSHLMIYLLLTLMFIVGVGVDVGEGVHAGLAEDVEGEDELNIEI